ncbi:MAG: rhamnan synthesis F family protein [Rhodobacteraceae bacterium]|nr:rhamnan synthesis F family protein [Paracoccaceae bacterium]
MPRTKESGGKTRHRIERFLSHRLGWDPLRKDVAERARPSASWVQPVALPASTRPPSSSVAIFAHFNPMARVSRMVEAQLRLLAAEGFAIDFVSMTPIAAPRDRQRIAAHVAHAVTRRNFGRDFGAWRDMWLLNRARYLEAEEVLLLNDSILGPIHPLGPVFAAMRDAGDGVFGLTDSPDRVPHLQSYFLLFRGRDAIRALDGFFEALHLSFNKRRMIERGEMGLARAMRRAGVPMRALFPYEDLELAVLNDTAALEALCACYPALRSDLPSPGDPAANWHRARLWLSSRLYDLSLNPTHYFWRLLVERFGFPYVKTELVVVNPARLPDLRGWLDALPEDSPVSAGDIREHLEMVSG